MESKKTKKADLTKKSSFFFSIGLLISMGIIITAFEWDYTDGDDINLSGKNINMFDDIMEIPPTEQPPPPPPKVQQPHIVEVPDEDDIEDDIEIIIDVDMTDDTKVDQIVVAQQEPEEEVDEIFTIVENPATPKGGIAAFYKYVGDNMKYPSQARRMGIEGRVFIEFIIDKNGTIGSVRVVKGIGASCDEEAVRMLQNSPAWNPGRQRGKPVKQKMVLPITFKLQ